MEKKMLHDKKLLVFSFAIMFTSLFRISVRDPTASSIGVQEVYELGLQGIAVALLMIGVYKKTCRFQFTPVMVIWPLFAFVCIVSCFWAPSQTLSLAKGLQLFILSLAIPVMSLNFSSRYTALRFLVLFGTVILCVIILAQIATQGISSVWKVYELGNVLYDGIGRYRLSILSSFPLDIGTLTGVLILILIGLKPRRLEWGAIGILTVIHVLTDSRTALGFLILFIAIYGLLYLACRGNGWEQILFAVLFITTGITLLFALCVFNGVPMPSFIESYLPRDMSSLNGRLPLWEDIFSLYNSSSGLQRLFGYGFASFRFYGPMWFSWAGEAHNAFLQVVFETGLVGFLMWTGAILTTILRVWKRGSSRISNMIHLIPIAYLIVMQLVNSNLADSRSFDLFVLLFYSCAFSVTTNQSETYLPYLKTKRMEGTKCYDVEDFISP